MPTGDTRRLERLLSFRREEEERARGHEAAVLKQVQAARGRVGRLEAQLIASRDTPLEFAAGSGLIDAQRYAGRLQESLDASRRALTQEEARLAQVRAEVAKAGRRRLAIERLADATKLERRQREDAVGQADLDESGRLRSARARALMEEG